MVKIIADPALLATLHNLDTVLEFCDPSGRTLGFFQPASGATTSGKPLQSPFSIEEIQRRRQQRCGKPLGEIMKRLERT